MSTEICAQKIGAAEIYYELLSYKKYKVTAQVYRKCNDSALNKLDGYVISDSIKVALNFTRISINRIDSTCGNPCNVENTYSNAGYERHVFTGIVDFNAQPYDKYVSAGKCAIRFAIHQKLRIPNGTLYIDSTYGPLYIDALVNICLNIKKNRSPEFTFDPKFYACCNQPFTYNMGFVDSSDFDSLGLTLVPILSDVSKPIKYNGNLNSQLPMTPYCPPNPGVVNCRGLPNAKPPRGFYFDAETGDIIFTPVKCDEIGMIKVQISEYRKDSTNKYVLLGQVSREMVVEVKQCSDNNPPYFTGSNKYSVCDNNKICASIGAKDDPFLPKQTIPDTVTLKWNHGIPSAAFKIVDPTAREKTAEFCWTPKPEKGISYNRFAVQAYDKPCNITMSSKGYIVTRKPQALIHKVLTVTKCNQLNYKVIPLDTFNFPSINYRYQVKVFALDNPTNILYHSYTNSGVFYAPKNGKYIVVGETTVAGINCPYFTYDTVVLFGNSAIKTISNDTFFCQFDSIPLTTINDDFKAFKFKWFDSELDKNIVDSAKVYTTHLKGLKKRVWVEIMDGNSSICKDTITLYSRGSFTIAPIGGSKTICRGATGSYSITNVKGGYPFEFSWYKDGVFLGSDSVLKITLYKSSTLQALVSDSLNCPATNFFNVNVIQMPIIQMADTSICFNQNATIPANLSNNAVSLKYQWTLDNQITSVISNKFNFNVLSTHFLKLEIESIEASCKASKTILIKSYQLPYFRIIGDSLFHPSNYIKFSTDKEFDFYQWSNGKNTRDNNFWANTLAGIGKHKMTVTVTDSNGCKNSQTLNYRTNAYTDINNPSTLEILIYPNPAQDQITIVSLLQANYKIWTYDGKEISNGNINAGENTIQTNNLSEGIYIIEIIDENGSVSRGKLQIQR